MPRLFLLNGGQVAGEITAIKAQKRKRDRASIYLDGEYAFSVKPLVAASLRQGDYLSDERIRELQMEGSFHEAYDRALDYLAYRPRSSAEVRRYLKQKRVAGEVVEEVVGRLTEAELLDDLAFARYWVGNREAFSPRGPRLLTQELRQKGVDYEVVAEALAEVNEQDSARRAALKQASRYVSLDDELFRRRMHDFLMRRGFGYEVISEAISSLLGERSSVAS